MKISKEELVAYANDDLQNLSRPTYCRDIHSMREKLPANLQKVPKFRKLGSLWLGQLFRYFGKVCPLSLLHIRHTRRRDTHSMRGVTCENAAAFHAAHSPALRPPLTALLRHRSTFSIAHIIGA